MKNQGRHSLDWIRPELWELSVRGLRRQLIEHEGPQQPRLRIAGREVINFASNDYLGLAADPRLASAVAKALEREGWGGGASPLLYGRGQSHRELEARLARFEGTEAAIVFSSGYAANVGAITALVGNVDAVYSDSLNHASIVDGCRLSRAEVFVYRHGDVGHLAEMLAKLSTARRRLIVTDGVFSMDGDLAPLVELVDLAERHDCMLLVDEAHATGVFGARGCGVAEHLGLDDRLGIRVGTLSKALGGAGGFVCGSPELVELLVNRARTYVYSTAHPPAAMAAAVAALEIVDSEPQRRGELLSRASRLRQRLREQAWLIGNSESQIIPLIVGQPERAVALSAALWDRGLLVPAIRPPSVPAGQSRLRISLSYGHEPEMVEALLHALAELKLPTEH